MCNFMTCETAELLHRALQGEELCSEDLVGLIDRASGPEAAALHQLMHWIQDADIRGRDPEAAQWYRSELTRLLSELGSTAP